MKFKFLLPILGLFALGACQCDTTDKVSMKSSGSGRAPAKKKPAPKPKYPAKRAAPVQKAKFSHDRVFFGFDKYSLTGDAKKTLKGQKTWLAQNPKKRVVIEGNCDERGTREYNIGLGARRANAVREYLIAEGVSPNRIVVTSNGKDKPLVAGSNPKAWAQNRNALTRPY